MGSLVARKKKKATTYFSKGFGGKHFGLSIYEKEYLPAIHVAEEWMPYMLGIHFIIKTDHQSLTFLLYQKITNTMQQKGLAKLLGLDHSIQYKKGVDNKVVDALSRRFESSEPFVNVITMVNPEWIEEIILSYESDEWAKENLATALVDPSNQPNVSVIKVGCTLDLVEN